eukprot:6455533-Prymnesium_polylepis.3
MAARADVDGTVWVAESAEGGGTCEAMTGSTPWASRRRMASVVYRHGVALQVRFQCISVSIARCISWVGGSSNAPDRTRLNHAACSPCVRMLLKVETSLPMKATPGSLTGSMER